MSKYGLQNTPKEMMLQLATNMKMVRKEQKITQKKLSELSGVAYATIKKFETTGIIALESLLKLSKVLNRLEEFEQIFLPKGLEDKQNLFDV